MIYLRHKNLNSILISYNKSNFRLGNKYKIINVLITVFCNFQTNIPGYLISRANILLVLFALTFTIFNESIYIPPNLESSCT